MGVLKSAVRSKQVSVSGRVVLGRVLFNSGVLLEVKRQGRPVSEIETC